MGYGVPPEWVEAVQGANEDRLLELAEHLPAEAAEAVLDLAVGKKPVPKPPFPTGIDPFSHPDAQRRFRVMGNQAELEQALAFPWEKWTIFLHPSQKELVEKDYSGPARISGSAGTGKTIVALHRAVFLARSNPKARVLLTTFSQTLANALHTKLCRLIHTDPQLGERLEVQSLNEVGLRLYQSNFGAAQVADLKSIGQLIEEAAGQVEGHKFSQRHLVSEWAEVVDAWGLTTWEAYRDVRRLGRKVRLSESQRAILWTIFKKVKQGLEERQWVTQAEVFNRLAVKLAETKNPPFDFAVVDEAQDLNIAQLRFLAALCAHRPKGLFFTGDLGQRIFGQPFSWKALGVEIQGRCKSLRINYRTSHQIRKQADRLLAGEMTDVDGIKEDRKDTLSVFNGPSPLVVTFENETVENQKIGLWLNERTTEGIMPQEIGVFVRSEAQMDRARAALDLSKLPYQVLDESVETTAGQVSLCTMHLAKGLEFRAVVVMACDDDILPLQKRIDTTADESELEEVYHTERHLLYVACTRARDQLWVSGIKPASEFLEDLRG